jgi:hypothetical protein
VVDVEPSVNILNHKVLSGDMLFPRRWDITPAERPLKSAVQIQIEIPLVVLTDKWIELCWLGVGRDRSGVGNCSLDHWNLAQIPQACLYVRLKRKMKLNETVD